MTARQSQILEAYQRLGSVAAAARDLGIGYGYAYNTVNGRAEYRRREYANLKRRRINAELRDRVQRILRRRS